jgi:metal iron transporter
MSGRALRIFEGFVALLVLGVVVCFCFQLSLVRDVSIGEVFRGYLPSSALVKSKGYAFPSSLLITSSRR